MSDLIHMGRLTNVPPVGAKVAIASCRNRQAWKISGERPAWDARRWIRSRAMLWATGRQLLLVISRLVAALRWFGETPRGSAP